MFCFHLRHTQRLLYRHTWLTPQARPALFLVGALSRLLTKTWYVTVSQAL
jgi:hypothetical protein